MTDSVKFDEFDLPKHFVEYEEVTKNCVELLPKGTDSIALRPLDIGFWLQNIKKTKDYLIWT